MSVLPRTNVCNLSYIQLTDSLMLTHDAFIFDVEIVAFALVLRVETDGEVLCALAANAVVQRGSHPVGGGPSA